MSAGAIFGAVLFATLALAAYCLWAVHHEYETHRKLSMTTVAAAWAFHLLHGVLTCQAAWSSSWPLPVGRILSLAAGIALLVQGMGLVLAGAVGLSSFRQLSGLRDETLVRTGAYRLSRNPLSVGWAMALLGVGALGRSGLAIALVALYWITFRVYVTLEERHLERLHGDDYRRYKTDTPRYLGIPRRPR